MKPITFLGNSKNDLLGFPARAKREAGYQLHRIQDGLEPLDWKPMNSIGLGVREVRINCEGAYRVIYVAKHEDCVYVLHSFRKKSQKTRKSDIDIAKKALSELTNTKI